MDHFDTFGENFDFDTFKNDTFESVWVDRHPLCTIYLKLGLFGMLKLALALQFIVTNAYFSVACNTKVSVRATQK